MPSALSMMLDGGENMVQYNHAAPLLAEQNDNVCYPGPWSGVPTVSWNRTSDSAVASRQARWDGGVRQSDGLHQFLD
jgi:hypothetical protein